MRRIAKLLGAALLVLAVVLACGLLLYGRGAALVLQGAGATGWMGTAAAWRNRPFEERDEAVRWRGGTLRGRLYRPGGPPGRTVVLVPGVHASGIDEPRLVAFARDLANKGVGVVTPEMSDLKRYAITSRTTDMIEDAAAWVLARDDLAPDGRIGLMGISFSGGLTLVASGRPSIRDRVAFAFSFGGHADFARVLRYLCTGELPDGTVRPPHDYGVAVILLNLVDRVVPADQVPRLREAILAFLTASHLDMLDKQKARQEFDRAKRLQAALPEPAATLMHFVNTRDVAALGPRLLPHVEAFGKDSALSPARSAAPAAAVYLLHGSQDNVIPALESALLAEQWKDVTEVHFLASPLITHAAVDRPVDLWDGWKLIAFWSDLLRE